MDSNPSMRSCSMGELPVPVARTDPMPYPSGVAGKYVLKPATTVQYLLRNPWLQVVMHLLNLDNQWRFRKMPGPAPRIIFGNTAEVRARMAPIAYTMVRQAPATPCVAHLHSPSLTAFIAHNNKLSRYLPTQLQEQLQQALTFLLIPCCSGQQSMGPSFEPSMCASPW